MRSLAAGGLRAMGTLSPSLSPTPLTALLVRKNQKYLVMSGFLVLASSSFVFLLFLLCIGAQKSFEPCYLGVLRIYQMEMFLHEYLKAKEEQCLTFFKLICGKCNVKKNKAVQNYLGSYSEFQNERQ